MGLPKLSDPLCWKKITQSQLADHVFGDHLSSSYTMSRYGVPISDIQLAKFRNFSFQKQYESFLDLFESNTEFLSQRVFGEFTSAQIIDRSFQYMEDKKIIKVDWNNFREHIYDTNIQNVELNRLTFDLDFIPTGEKENSLFDSYIEKVIEEPGFHKLL